MTDLTDTIKELRRLLRKRPFEGTTAELSHFKYTVLPHLPVLLDAAEKAERFEKALNGALGYLRNARIDLETGAPKRTAINTISGGISMIEKVIDNNMQEANKK